VITYDVTGPLGSQVSVLGPYLHDARPIGDFGSVQEAEAFADRMREIDAGSSHVSPMPQHREMDDPKTDDLIDRNHLLIMAATKARSDVRANLLKAEQMRITWTVLPFFNGVRNHSEPERLAERTAATAAHQRDATSGPVTRHAWRAEAHAVRSWCQQRPADAARAISVGTRERTGAPPLPRC
jgi:hypothetical protein